MKQSIFEILDNKPLTESVYEMRLAGDTADITAPGQFVNIKLDGLFLRRPISVCDRTDGVLTIVYKVVGKGTEAMSAMVSGEKLELTFRNDAPEKPMLYLINRVEGCTERQRGYFTAAEMEIGKAEITVNVAPGSYYVYTVAKNQYGFYASAPCFFTVEEE